MPDTDPMQDRVDVPEPPLIVVELKLHDRFVEFVVTARVTVPVKPFTGATMKVDVPATPTLTLTLVLLAIAVKSRAWNTMLAV